MDEVRGLVELCHSASKLQLCSCQLAALCQCCQQTDCSSSSRKSARRQQCAPAIAPLQLTVSHITLACCRFGVDYSSSCSIDLALLLSQLDYTSNGPRFYDPYIMQVRCCGAIAAVS